MRKIPFLQNKMITFAFIIIILLAIVPDLYIWSNFLKNVGPIIKVLYCLPFLFLLTLPLLGALEIWRNGIFQALIFLLLLTVIPKYIFLLFSMAGKGIAMLWPTAANIGNITGIVCGLLMIMAFAYGMTRGWKRVTIMETHIEARHLPRSFDGYTMVQLSDFHIGTYRQSPDMVQEIVDKVNNIKPDIILFTGDMVNLSADELTPFIHILSKMKAKDGVYSIVGNHDYCTYGHHGNPMAATVDFNILMKMERKMGWKVLLNENYILHRGADSIAIVGVENGGESPFPSRADLSKATQGLDNDTYKILLSHDPSHWRREVLTRNDIHLTLSGHTHAMQLKIGDFSPSQWKYPEWGGLYKEGNKLLHVSTGIGSNVPFRLGAWPEINVLRLSAE